jgi:uncharacterized protein (DUF1330 family)
MHYTVAMIYISDNKWVRRYAKEVTAMVERFGGRYLARTGAAEQFEGSGERPSVFLLIEWSSREAAHSFYSSSEYQEHLAARLRGSSGCNWLVPGEDEAGLARVAPVEASSARQARQR